MKKTVIGGGLVAAILVVGGLLYVSGSEQHDKAVKAQTTASSQLSETQMADETTRKEKDETSIIAESDNENRTTETGTENEQNSLTMDVRSMSVEQISELFSRASAADIIGLVEMSRNPETGVETIVILDNGSVLSGGAFIEGVEVDSETDANGMTVDQLQEVIQAHQQELDRLSQEYAQIE